MNIWRLLKVGCLALILILARCKGDDIIISTDNVDDNRILSGALPAINFSYTIADGLKDLDEERLSVGENGLLYFRSMQDVSIAWDQLAAINDVNESRSTAMSDIVDITSSAPFEVRGNISTQEKIKFNSKDEVRYDKGTFKEGDLSLSIEVPLGIAGLIEITVPESNPLIKVEFYINETNQQYQHSFSMKDREIVFKQGVDSSYVTLNVESNLVFPGPPSGNLDIDFNLTNIKTEKLHGYFGQAQSALINHTKEIDNMDGDMGLFSFELKDITYTLRTNNYMGVPFDLEATNIRFFKTVEGAEVVDVLHVNGVSKIDMDVDAAIDGNPIKPAHNSFEVNPENSDIVDVGNPFPKKLIIDLITYANPDGDDPATPNFIGEVDSLYATLEIGAPVWLKAKEYVRKDTIDFDFRKMMDNDRANADLIETLAMYLDFFNKLPFQVNANLFVADSLGNKIEDILSDFESLLAVGELNSAGKVENAKETNVVVKFEKSQIQKFFDQKAMFLILETKTSSYKNESEFVKVFDDASMKVAISLEASGRIPDFN